MTSEARCSDVTVIFRLTRANRLSLPLFIDLSSCFTSRSEGSLETEVLDVVMTFEAGDTMFLFHFIEVWIHKSDLDISAVYIELFAVHLSGQRSASRTEVDKRPTFPDSWMRDTLSAPNFFVNIFSSLCEISDS